MSETQERIASTQIAPFKYADGQDMKIGKNEVDPEAKDWLVYNKRQAPLEGVHLAARSPLGMGVERESYDRHLCQMWPGLNYVSRTLFEKLVETNPTFERMCRRYVKVVGTAKAFASSDDVERAEQMVINTSDVDTLVRIRKEGGKLPKRLASAVDDEIEDLGMRDKQERDARLTQRRVNRRRGRL